MIPCGKVQDPGWHRLRPVAFGAGLLASADAAFAASSLPQAHDLWVANLLAAVFVGLLAASLSRWWSVAGIVVVASIAYAARYSTGFAFAELAVRLLGNDYLAQAQLSSMLVPVGALIGAVAGATRLRRA